jgi:hypothetical protein
MQSCSHAVICVSSFSNFQIFKSTNQQISKSTNQQIIKNKDMKTLVKSAITILTCIVAQGQGFGQTMNWQSLKKEDKHVLNINSRLEYGLIFGAGFGYQLNTKMPVVLNLEYSIPSGKNVTDDFKSKIGGNVRLYHINNFQFSANIYGVYRRYETNLVRMKNFGSDFSGVIGFYKPKWFLAGEVGFDKAIVTNLKHSQAYRDVFPEVTDGWYSPPSGGNFYYGAQTGFSFKNQDIYLKAGKVITQDFKTKPTVPFFAQIGVNFRF